MTTAEDQDKRPELPESTRAAIKANAARWAAKPIPDHIILKTRRIWNSNLAASGSGAESHD